MSESTQTERQDITINSNWIITVGMVLLFAVITFLLGWSVRDLLFDRVSLGLSQGDRDRWINTFSGAIGSVSFFALAYSFRGIQLKIALFLFGVNCTIRTVLPYLHISVDGRHFAAVAAALSRQITYVILLFAIAQWFKTVIGHAPPRDREARNS